MVGQAAGESPAPHWTAMELVADGEVGGLSTADPYADIRMPESDVDGRRGVAILKRLDLPPLEVPRRFLSLVLAPVFEANQLLPAGLDPFLPDGTDPSKLPASPANLEKDFTPAKQKELLGLTLTPRADGPNQKASWHWQAQAGGSFRQGSSSNTNMQALFLAERQSAHSYLMANMGAVYNENGGQDDNRRWFAKGLFDRSLRGRWLGYIRDEAEYDEARKIRIRDIFSTGLGFRFIDHLKERWLVRTGPTGTYVDYAASANLSDSFQSGWLVESDFRKVLGDSVRFEWIATAYPDFVNRSTIRLRNEAALTFPIGGLKSRWNWKIGAWHEYQSRPAFGTQFSDFEATFAIVYTNNYAVTSLAVPPPLDPSRRDGL